MAESIQLISTDFDGTLHAEFESPSVPHDLQTLLGDLQHCGAKWIINTGRDLSSVMETLARARLAIKPDYIVTVEREIYVHADNRYEPLAEWNRECARAHRELYHRIAPDVPRLFAWVNERYEATLYNDVWSPFCIVADTNENMDAIQVFLDEYCRKTGEVTLVRNDVYARFSHVSFNKGTALGEIAHRLNIHRNHVLAAGDHLNDLPMLSAEIARCLVAPDNAVPQVKEAVLRQHGYVSHQPWGHGVARGLEHYLGRS
jgi:HAD superfamily hydrolase (TIGR01484 family)